MIRGMHAMFYSSEAEALRAFLRDKLGLTGTDVGGGWLIFDAPEADLGVPPDRRRRARLRHGRHLVLLRRHRATVAELKGRGRRVHAGGRGPRLRPRHVLQGARRLQGAALPAEVRQVGAARATRPAVGDDAPHALRRRGLGLGRGRGGADAARHRLHAGRGRHLGGARGARARRAGQRHAPDPDADPAGRRGHDRERGDPDLARRQASAGAARAGAARCAARAVPALDGLRVRGDLRAALDQARRAARSARRRRCATRSSTRCTSASRSAGRTWMRSWRRAPTCWAIRSRSSIST